MARTILILAANPKDTPPLRLDKEVREIDSGLQRAQKRTEFILKQQWATRPMDVRRAVLDAKPAFVHFCGHGAGEEGIAFEDDAGRVQLVRAEALAGFFELFADQVECVVLNACYSEIQAAAIAQHINYVIGMRKEIGDTAALEFAVAFYDALGAGQSVEFAYKLACNAIQWMRVPEHLIPILKTKPRASRTVPASSEAERKAHGSVSADPQKTLFGGREYTLIKTISNYEDRTVYKVSDASGQLFIIKCYRTNIVSEKAQAQLVKIRSQHVVTPVEVWQYEGHSYEKLPYLQGWRVSDALTLSRYGLCGTFLGQFIDDIGLAIAILHNQGLVHRDIHPDNVIFSRQAYGFVLIDCSYAICVDDQKQLPLGRTGYSDGYQLSGKADFMSDLYAFGATLFDVVYRRSLPAYEKRAKALSGTNKIRLPRVRDKAHLDDGVDLLLAVDRKRKFKRVEEFLGRIRNVDPTWPHIYEGILRTPDEEFVFMGSLGSEIRNAADGASTLEWIISDPRTNSDLRAYAQELLNT